MFCRIPFFQDSDDETQRGRGRRDDHYLNYPPESTPQDGEHQTERGEEIHYYNADTPTMHITERMDQRKSTGKKPMPDPIDRALTPQHIDSPLSSPEPASHTRTSLHNTEARIIYMHSVESYDSIFIVVSCYTVFYYCE